MVLVCEDMFEGQRYIPRDCHWLVNVDLHRVGLVYVLRHGNGDFHLLLYHLRNLHHFLNVVLVVDDFGNLNDFLLDYNLGNGYLNLLHYLLGHVHDLFLHNDFRNLHHLVDIANFWYLDLILLDDWCNTLHYKLGDLV